ncbi:hypothetical protein GFS60_05572 [Rhodococcus sp. WAY2]|nr:hypothetical protein GFS60_05572 [Rhodococcus sp. WAY2]
MGLRPGSGPRGTGCGGTLIQAARLPLPVIGALGSPAAHARSSSVSHDARISQSGISSSQPSTDVLFGVSAPDHPQHWGNPCQLVWPRAGIRAVTGQAILQSDIDL